MVFFTVKKGSNGKSYCIKSQGVWQCFMSVLPRRHRNKCSSALHWMSNLLTYFAFAVIIIMKNFIEKANKQWFHLFMEIKVDGIKLIFIEYCIHKFVPDIMSLYNWIVFLLYIPFSRLKVLGFLELKLWLTSV